MRLAEIADRIAVEAVITALARWLDGQGGDPRDIYDEQVVVRGPRGELRGLDELVDHVQRADTGEHTQHANTDLPTELDRDVAVTYLNSTTQFYEPGSAPYRSAGMRIRCGQTRRTAGWRIASIAMQLTWLHGGMPATPAPRDADPVNGAS